MEQGTEMAAAKMYRAPEPGGDSLKTSEIPAAGDRLSQNLDRLGHTIAVLYERLDAGGVLSPNLPLSEPIRGEEPDSSGAPMAMRLSAMADSVESFRESVETIIRRLEV